MTQFEKALLSELKGIRKALEKLNLNSDVAIPAPQEILAMQMAQMKREEENVTERTIDAKNIKIEIPKYDPLGRPTGRC